MGWVGSEGYPVPPHEHKDPSVPGEGPLRALSDEEANEEYIEQDTQGPLTQHQDLRIPVEGPVRALSDEEANGEYIRQDAQGPHIQHKDPSIPVEGPVHALSETKLMENVLSRMPRVPTPNIRI
jgi:hypothetical protein